MKIKTVKVKKVVYLSEKRDLYDITVEKNHNFFVKLGENKYLLSSNCHAMSASAKQNLLKPLEEPPKHVLWALCTTDPDKLPKATLTRCIKLYYEYPGLMDCSKRLWKVAKHEYSEDVSSKIKPFIKKIAQNTNGQMRDSYSILESIAAIISADPNVSEKELAKEFVTVLTSLGELTTPAIRYITYMLLDRYTLPLNIINELDPSRINEFVNTLARHVHFASLFFVHKKENTLKELDKKRFYGINFIRYEAALNTTWEKLHKKYDSDMILYKVVCLSNSILEAVNKIRMGLITPEQSILCSISSYMKEMLMLKKED